MRKILLILVACLLVSDHLHAQLEPTAGSWETWFIPSGKAYRLPAPASYKDEIEQVISLQQNLDSARRQQMIHWDGGSPGYRWHGMMSKLWMTDTSGNGVLPYMLLAVATYDATIAAWDSKYAYKRPRPYAADSRIKSYLPKSESPSYPCEHSVAAGVAATIVAHFFPSMATSVNRQAQEIMASRIAAGAAFPSDTRAGFELGKKIAEKEIEYTKAFTSRAKWDGKVPEGPHFWKEKNRCFLLRVATKPLYLTAAASFVQGRHPTSQKKWKNSRTSNPHSARWRMPFISQANLRMI